MTQLIGLHLELSNYDWIIRALTQHQFLPGQCGGVHTILAKTLSSGGASHCPVISSQEPEQIDFWAKNPDVPFARIQQWKCSNRYSSMAVI